MNELCLFAGIGGGLLGTKLLGFRTVCYVENGRYCIDVLKARIADGFLDDAPIWDDVKTFNGYPWSGLVDILTAGFPCQPFSVAGKQAAGEDDRNLWPDTIRVIREVRPRFCLLENVPGLLAGSHGYFGRILGELSESGYNARWRVVSAADVGAPHLRKRVWILAYPKQSAARLEEHRSGRRKWGNVGSSQPEILRQRDREIGSERVGASSEDVAYTDSKRKAAMDRQPEESIWGSQEMAYSQSPGLGRQYAGGFQSEVKRSGEVGNAHGECLQGQRRGCGVWQSESQQPSGKASATDWWAEDPAERPVESRVGRLVDGIPDRVDRQRAIGNAQIPGVVRLAWHLLTEGVNEY